MKIKMYEYAKCSTCRKAQKYLDAKGADYVLVPIRETPPSKAELKKMLGIVGNIKKLFNVSGQDYRALGIKDKIEGMSEAQALDLLASNGNLIKRPFLLKGETGAVGFDPEEWNRLIP
jgi:arsenate reductase